MLEKTKIDKPSDITTLLENYLEKADKCPENFVAALFEIEKAFTAYIAELETHEQFSTKYLLEWRQLTGLTAVVKNLKENSKDDGGDHEVVCEAGEEDRDRYVLRDWEDQRPYVNFIKRVWEPFPKFFATENRSSKP